MRPEQGDPAYLWDMLDAARAIREFVRGKRVEDYLGDRMLRGAVERHPEVTDQSRSVASEVMTH